MNNNYNLILTGDEIDFEFSELKKIGVYIYHYPMILISKLENLVNPNDYDFIIFTSKNGVKYFMDNLTERINDS